jgi:hypothetical protein
MKDKVRKFVFLFAYLLLRQQVIIYAKLDINIFKLPIFDLNLDQFPNLV